MLSNHKLHILILYVMLILTLLIIGYGLLRSADEPEGSRAQNTKSDNRTFFWDIYPELVIPNTGKVIDKKLKLRSQQEEDIAVRELSREAPLLVFRYSRFDCQLCIDQVLDKLHAVFEEDNLKVRLIIDGMTGREFRMKYKEREMNFSAYFLSTDNLNLSLENKNLPFLFVLSKDAKVDKIFIPFREYPNQTDAYLKNIKSLLRD